jgi:hypothetical protein
MLQILISIFNESNHGSKKPSKSLLELNFSAAKLQSLFIKFFSHSNSSFNTKLMKHLTRFSCSHLLAVWEQLLDEIMSLDFSCFGSGTMSDLNFQFYYTFSSVVKAKKKSWQKVSRKRSMNNFLSQIFSLAGNKNHFVDPE